MVSQVQNSGDTVFRFDPDICEKLFNVMDEDKSGKLTVAEVLAAGRNPKVAAYVANSHQPTLEFLVRGSTKNGRGSGGHGSSSSGDGGGGGGRPRRGAKMTRKMATAAAEGVRKAVMEVVDANKDGVVDFAEWRGFIGHLRAQRLVFLKQRMLVKRRCYFGKGLAPGAPFANPLGLVRAGWLARGWCEDFSYYARNNHPLLVTCCSDGDAPFSPRERRVDAFCTFSVTLLGAALLLQFGPAAKAAAASTLGLKSDSLAGAGGYSERDAFEGYRDHAGAAACASTVQLLFVSLPLMASRLLGFYLLGCPCLVSDASTHDAATARRFACYRRLEPVAAVAVASVGLCCLALALLAWHAHGAFRAPGGPPPAYWVLDVALYFPQTWLYWVLQTCLVEFNPSLWLANLLTCAWCCPWMRILTGELLGVGQWHHERAKVLKACRAAIAKGAFVHAPAIAAMAAAGSSAGAEDGGGGGTRSPLSQQQDLEEVKSFDGDYVECTVGDDEAELCEEVLEAVLRQPVPLHCSPHQSGASGGGGGGSDGGDGGGAAALVEARQQLASARAEAAAEVHAAARAHAVALASAEAEAERLRRTLAAEQASGASVLEEVEALRRVLRTALTAAPASSSSSSSSSSSTLSIISPAGFPAMSGGDGFASPSPSGRARRELRRRLASPKAGSAAVDATLVDATPGSLSSSSSLSSLALASSSLVDPSSTPAKQPGMAAGGPESPQPWTPTLAEAREDAAETLIGLLAERTKWRAQKAAVAAVETTQRKATAAEAAETAAAEAAEEVATTIATAAATAAASAAAAAAASTAAQPPPDPPPAAKAETTERATQTSPPRPLAPPPAREEAASQTSTAAEAAVAAASTQTESAAVAGDDDEEEGEMSAAAGAWRWGHGDGPLGVPFPAHAWAASEADGATEGSAVGAGAGWAPSGRSGSHSAERGAEGAGWAPATRLQKRWTGPEESDERSSWGDGDGDGGARRPAFSFGGGGGGSFDRSRDQDDENEHGAPGYAYFEPPFARLPAPRDGAPGDGATPSGGDGAPPSGNGAPPSGDTGPGSYAVRSSTQDAVKRALAQRNLVKRRAASPAWSSRRPGAAPFALTASGGSSSSGGGGGGSFAGFGGGGGGPESGPSGSRSNGSGSGGSRGAGNWWARGSVAGSSLPTALSARSSWHPGEPPAVGASFGPQENPRGGVFRHSQKKIGIEPP